MAKRLGIKAKVRAEIGGRRPRRIRASGRVPAILYYPRVFGFSMVALSLDVRVYRMHTFSVLSHSL